VTATQFVAAVVRTEVIAALLIVLGLVQFGIARRARLRKRTRTRNDLAARFTRIAAGDALSAADRVALASAGTRNLTASLAQIARSVDGATRQRLSEAARELGVAEAASRELDSSRWWIRLGAARCLSTIGADSEQLRRLIADPEPFVRAEAAVCVAFASSRDDAALLLPMLTDPAPVCRFAARDALMRIPGVAAPIIADALARNEGDIAVLLTVAATMPSHQFQAAALQYSSDAPGDTRCAAVAVLRGIGGPACIARLRAMLLDDDASVRCAAADALGTLADWRSAFALRRLLGDASSDVRLQAARALQRLGAPGVLMLRDAAAAAEALPAAIAQQALDIMMLASANGTP
jgi:HEAT repeat protein